LLSKTTPRKTVSLTCAIVVSLITTLKSEEDFFCHGLNSIVYLKGRRAPGNLILPGQFQKFSNIFFWPISGTNSKISGTGSVKVSSFCP